MMHIEAMQGVFYTISLSKKPPQGEKRRKTDGSSSNT